MLNKDDTFHQEYLNRINKVLDYIEQHLEDDLSLNLLAEKAHFSSFHFHRLFTLTVGEPINQLINRLRLERSVAHLLAHPTTPIKDVAYKYGFNHENSFSRSFKKRYGITATQLKDTPLPQLSKIGILPLSIDQYFSNLTKAQNEMRTTAKIEIKNRDRMHLAAITNIGKLEEIPTSFHQLFQWLQKHPSLAPSAPTVLTIYHDNPKVTDMDKVRNSACVSVNKSFPAENTIRPLSIAKGTYAVAQFELHPSEIQKAWDHTLAWILTNKLTFAEGHYYEVYLNDPTQHPELKATVEICIPVESDQTAKRISSQGGLNTYKKHVQEGTLPKQYQQLIAFLRQLSNQLHKTYAPQLKLGKLYEGNMEYSYLPFSSPTLKPLKLKFVLVLDHNSLCFNICLSGQNKSIRKKYWQLLKESNYTKYPLVKNIDNSLSIVEFPLDLSYSFDEEEHMRREIEEKTLDFVRNIDALFEH